MRVMRETSESQYLDWTRAGHTVKGATKMAECPGCGHIVKLGSKVEVGERLDCPECGETLEVISLRPLELDYAFDDEGWEGSEDEDWDEEWEEEEA